MLACFLARELGMRRVIVPPTPGVLSAFGGIIADIRNDFIRTVYADLDTDVTDTLASAAEGLRLAGLAWLHEEQGFDGTPVMQFSADMRYRGQSYEIDTPLTESWIADGDLAAITAAFHKEHERLYDYADGSAPLQIINLRLVVSGVRQSRISSLGSIRCASPTDGEHGDLLRWPRANGRGFPARGTACGPAIFRSCYRHTGRHDKLYSGWIFGLCRRAWKSHPELGRLNHGD